jgi:predicted RNA-binding Zn-ribbon protein involved in translation (DUF1610 family)
MEKTARGVEQLSKKKPDGQNAQYTVDFTQLEDDGSFACPKCGAIISPDDDTEETYRVLETEVQNNELAALTIECGTCRSIIRLTGMNKVLEALPS